MKKLFFIYDTLLIKKVQAILNIPLEFVSYGYAHGKLYFMYDGKRRRHFFIKARGRCVYGAIFVLDQAEEYERVVHSFYNCSYKYTNTILTSDLYKEDTVSVTPITFNSLTELCSNVVTRLESIECSVFVGNEINPTVKNSLTKYRYYKKNDGIDAVSFLTLVKERGDERLHEKG